MNNNYYEFRHFKACCDDAPTGTYDQAKELNVLLGDACDKLIQDLRAMGLKADNCDLIYHVEAALYNYVKQSNPDSTLFPVAEGFGSSMDSPARDRVIAQAASNRDFLNSLSAI